MPSVNLSIYLNDETYPAYAKKKEEYNEIGRNAVMNAIKKDEEEKEHGKRKKSGE